MAKKGCGNFCGSKFLQEFPIFCPFLTSCGRISRGNPSQKHAMRDNSREFLTIQINGRSNKSFWQRCSESQQRPIEVGPKLLSFSSELIYTGIFNNSPRSLLLRRRRANFLNFTPRRRKDQWAPLRGFLFFHTTS